jgi:osmotically-inducible protein OsmY
MPAATAEVQRTDAEITTDVQGRFYQDSTVRASRVDVDTNNQVVTLSGSVQSDEARQRALELARGVEGVTSVEDRLMVAALAEPAASTMPDRPDAARTAAADRDPAPPGWITTKIQAQYFVSGEIKPWNIDVTTSSDGVVTLRGTVDDAQAKSEAVRIAQATEGVTRVDDELVVQQGDTSERAKAAAEPVTDAWVTIKVQSKFYVDDDVRGRNIDVTTVDGVVTLTGTVLNAEERRRALTLARTTDGVREVKDQLTLSADVTPRADRSTAEPDRPVTQALGDAWITTKVQSQFFLDPEVKGSEIDVDTRNGVVTLSGTVDTPELKAKAEEIARDTEGANRVVNQLTVTAR